MGKEFVVLQGKTFFVELQSMLGSTNYGWCVKSMPKEIILMGMDNIPVRSGRGPIIQRFYFGAASAEELNVEIDFALTCFSDLTDVSDEFKANIRIMPSESEEFTDYSENDPKLAPFYGIIYAGGKGLGGGCPSNGQEAAVKYGYPCGTQDALMKYGYPCGTQDALMKYGYPCGTQDALMKYGYPCGAQDALMKYGYPCGLQEANLKYGFVCAECAKDTRDYGLSFMELTKDARPYGYPFMDQED